jgi:hypothetical protein
MVRRPESPTAAWPRRMSAEDAAGLPECVNAFRDFMGERQTRRLTLSNIRPIPRRGLSRTEAAIYVGISPTKFDQLVGDRRMPRAISVDGRKIWDIRQLDIAFDGLAMETEPEDQTWADFETGSSNQP